VIERVDFSDLAKAKNLPSFAKIAFESGDAVAELSELSHIAN
jgi:hypothetical protein